MVRLSTAGLPEWLDACRRAGLEMRRSGRDWCGPCPVCQTGDDRFAIRAGEKRPVIVNARYGHTWLELMRALNPDTGSGGEVARTAAACRRDAPGSRGAADPRQLPQARNARRMLARAHRGRPTYFRKRFPAVDKLVWTLDGTTWLVPLRIVRNGQLLPGLAGLQYILADGTRRFQKDATTRGLVAVPRWTATGPLLLAEGVTSAMALSQAIQDPPLGASSPRAPNWATAPVSSATATDRTNAASSPVPRPRRRPISRSGCRTTPPPIPGTSGTPPAPSSTPCVNGSPATPPTPTDARSRPSLPHYNHGNPSIPRGRRPRTPRTPRTPSTPRTPRT